MKTEIQFRKAIGLALLNIRYAMSEDLKITQRDIANQAAISTRYYGDIERGRVMPSAYTLAKIAKAIQMPLHKLCQQIDNYLI